MKLKSEFIRLYLGFYQTYQYFDLTEFPSASAVWTNFNSTYVARNLNINCNDQ